jgi:DNA-binding CsgD family transcriptional regulator
MWRTVPKFRPNVPINSFSRSSIVAARLTTLALCFVHCVKWGEYRVMRLLDGAELEALSLFAGGKTADEIAAALGVSKSMAMHYLRVAARKLGARNRVHAVAIAVRKGLIKSSGGSE